MPLGPRDAAGTIRAVTDGFLSPTRPAASRSEVFLGYLDYFRTRIAAKVESLSEPDQHRSRLPSGWTPLELVKHLTFVEMRWLEWGFEGRLIDDPWGDECEGRCHVDPDETAGELIAALRARGAHSRAVIHNNDLAAIGRPGPRWDGAEPAAVDRCLFHLVQEYARHLGHLDIVAELAGEGVGE